MPAHGGQPLQYTASADLGSVRIRVRRARKIAQSTSSGRGKTARIQASPRVCILSVQGVAVLLFFPGRHVVQAVVEIPIPGRALLATGEATPSERELPTLPAFVAGPENRLVEVAVRSLLANVDRHYNPIHLYGPPGSGKSHLAHGLARVWKSRLHRSIVCTSAREFARGLAEAIQTKTTNDFTAPYRTAALLVLEDIDALQGRDAAQQELIAIVDALADAGRRILVTARTEPGRLTGMKPRLRGRLNQGLVVRLAPPGRDARATIVGQLARLRGLQLTEEAADVLADCVAGTVPDLDEALRGLSTERRAPFGPIDREDVRRYLKRNSAPTRPSIRQVAAVVARHFSVSVGDLRSPSRRRAAVCARGVAMYLARNLTGLSLQRIGKYFGGRDHTTVSHGCRRTEERIETEPEIREALIDLQQRLAC